ncbi:MAG: L-rhamnose isomerase, partial [Victivallis vadensis]
AQEEARSLPWGAVWEYFCLTNDVPAGLGFLDEIRIYEKQVLEVRK